MKTSNSNRQRQDIPNTGQKGNSYSGEKTSLSLCIYIYISILNVKTPVAGRPIGSKRMGAPKMAIPGVRTMCGPEGWWLACIEAFHRSYFLYKRQDDGGASS